MTYFSLPNMLRCILNIEFNFVETTINTSRDIEISQDFSVITIIFNNFLRFGLNSISLLFDKFHLCKLILFSVLFKGITRDMLSGIYQFLPHLRYPLYLNNLGNYSITPF